MGSLKRELEVRVPEPLGALMTIGAGKEGVSHGALLAVRIVRLRKKNNRMFLRNLYHQELAEIVVSQSRGLGMPERDLPN